MGIDWYKLVGHDTLKIDDPSEAALGFERADRQVALDEIDEVRVSTVFLGLDHSFAEGPPLLFETLVFGGALDGEMNRYSTWEEAEAGHQEMIKRVRETQRGE